VSRFKKIVALLILLSQLMVAAQVAYAGFGITPPYVRNDTLTRGSQYTQEIILVRGDPVEELQAEVTINVDKIGQWITVEPSLTFPLPVGKKQVPMKVTVTVPEDAKYGNYTGNIRVRTSSAGGPSGGVSLALGAQIDVDLRVVDQIRDFDLRRVELTELEEGYSKWFFDYPGRITFGMYVENTGNAPTAPSKVRFDIYNKKGDRLLESTENLGSIDEVEPFDTKKVEAFLPTWLPAGGYLVKYQIYKEDEVVKKGELTLSVMPQGTVPNYEPFGFEALPLSDKLLIASPIALLLLIIIIVILVRKFLRARPKRVRQKPRRTPAATPAHNPPFRPAVPSRGPAVRAHGSVVDLSRKR
jgi:hypothetical protein